MMLLFAALMVAHWFGFTAPNIPESVQNSLLDIIMIGVGGYTVGRSAEKLDNNGKTKTKNIIDYLEAKMSSIEKARRVCSKVWGKIILQISAYLCTQL